MEDGTRTISSASPPICWLRCRLGLPTYPRSLVLLSNAPTIFVVYVSLDKIKVAKCEMDSDFLAKAAPHVDKALAEDYGGKRFCFVRRSHFHAKPDKFH